jgi:hypothetical protein
MSIETIATIGTGVLAFIGIAILVSYIHRKEIKFFEDAERIEILLKTNSITYDVAIEDLNKLRKNVKNRDERHRYYQIVKLIELKFNTDVV